MLVGPQHGRIEHHPVHLRGFEGLKNGFPHFFLGQSAETTADRIGLAEPLGQVGPRRPVRKSQATALKNSRLSRAVTPQSVDLPGNSGATKVHRRSVIS